MEIQSAIARWESEGGAIPQVQSSSQTSERTDEATDGAPNSGAD